MINYQKIKNVAAILLILCQCSIAFAHQPNFRPNYPNHLATDDGRRYLCLAILNVGNGEPWEFKAIEDFVLAGCNSVMITVRWEKVYKTLGSKADWSVIDKELALIQKLGAKVCLRVHLQRDRTDAGGEWWPQDATNVDDDGNLVHGQIAGGRSFSFDYQPMVDVSMDFVREVALRYQYLEQEGNLIYMSVTTNENQEAGYDFVNKKNPESDYYHVLFDYSLPTLNGYRNWLTKKYKDLKTLNKHWNSDYSSFAEVMPVGYSTFINEKPNLSVKSLDWYQYRHHSLKQFIDKTVATIKGVNPVTKVINDYGSVFDYMSMQRGTLGFISLAEKADGTKCNNADHYAHRFSGDLLRSNSPGKWIMNEIFRTPPTSSSMMSEMVNAHFAHGCKLVNYVYRNIYGDNELAFMKPIMAQVKRDWLDKPMTPIVPSEKMTVKLSEVLNSSGWYSKFIEQWNTLYLKTKKPIEVILVEDVIQGKITEAPVLVKALSDQTATAGQQVTLAIPTETFKDNDGTIVQYHVSGLPSGLVFSNNQITGTTAQTGEFVVTVSVKDNDGETASTTFKLTVKPKPLNQAPIVQNLIPYKSATVGVPFSFTIPSNVFKDNDGQITQISVRGLPSGIYQNGWTISGAATAAGTYSMTVTAYDNANASVSTPFVLLVTAPANQAPIVQNLISYKSATVGVPFSFTIPSNIFKDNDGQIVRVSVTGLPPGLSQNGSTIAGTATATGTYSVTVTAYDNANASISTSFVLFVTALANKEPFVRNIIPNQQANTKLAFNYPIPQNTFGDTDGSIVKLVVSGLPAGIVQNGWQLTGTATRMGIYTVTVQAFDDKNATVTTTFLITVTTDTKPVVVVPLTNQVTTVGEAFGYDILPSFFADPNGYIVRIIIIGDLPPGLVFESSRIAGKPTKPGTYNVTVRAIDNSGDAVNTSFTITVKPVPLVGNASPLVAQPIFPQEAVVGRAFSYVIPEGTFQDPEKQPLSYDARQLPPGLLYANNAIEGTPALAGVYTVIIKATDPQNASVETSFTITVRLPNSNTPPIVSVPIPDQTATVGKPFAYVIPGNTFQDAESRVSIAIAGLPNGINSFGSLLSGTPTKAGDFTVTVKAIDSQGASVNDYFVIRVTGGSTPPAASTKFEVSLYNAAKMPATKISVINEGDVVNVAQVPSANIFVSPNVGGIDNIRMALSGPVTTTYRDNTAPFAVFEHDGSFSPYLGDYVLNIKGYKGSVLIAEQTTKFSFSSGVGGSSQNAPISAAWMATPNPFEESFTVSLPLDYQPNHTRFSIINFVGQAFEITGVSWVGNEATLQVDRLPKGSYLLKISNEYLPQKSMKVVKR
jgi:Putative Ig domain/Beta-galactosidase